MRTANMRSTSSSTIANRACSLMESTGNRRGRPAGDLRSRFQVATDDIPAATTSGPRTGSWVSSEVNTPPGRGVASLLVDQATNQEVLRRTGGDQPGSVGGPLPHARTALDVNYRIMCLWFDEAFLGVEHVWQLLRERLGMATCNHIRKISPFRTTRGNMVRYDVIVDRIFLPELMARVRSSMCGIHVKEHVPYVIRHPNRPRRRTPVVRCGKDPSQVTIVSLNVCGLSQKRGLVEELLIRSNAHVACLQETLLRDNGWSLKLHSYDSFHVWMGSSGSGGGRGLVTLVHKSWGGQVIHAELDGTALWVKVFPPFLPRGLILVNVYFSQRGMVHRDGSMGDSKLRLIAARMERLGGGLPYMIMGDFNRSSDRAARLLDLPHLFTIPFEGDQRTFHRHGRPLGAIDFGFCDEVTATTGLIHAVVNRDCDMSDHYPVEFIWNPPGRWERPRKVWRQILPRTLGARATEFAHHNIWTALDSDAVIDSQADIDSAAVALHATIANVLGEMKLVKRVAVNPGKIQATYPPLPKTIVAEDKQRKRLFRVLQEAHRTRVPMTDRRSLEARYKAMVYRCKALRSRHASRTWAAKLAKESMGLLHQSSRSAFRFFKSLARRQRAAIGVRTLHRPDGSTATNKVEVTAILTNAFRTLLTCADGTGSDLAAWRAEEFVEHPPLPGQDFDLTWRHLCDAMQESPNTAPGVSGISNGILRACWTGKPSPSVGNPSPPDEPDSPLGRVLFKLCNAIWSTGKIPDSFRDVAILPLPKKGSPLEADNYRGISLIEVVLKLVSRVAAKALSGALERTGRLADEQGGFRPHRECSGQYLAVHDLAQERSREGKPTFAAFLDFRKAFDTVPIGALLFKLAAIGCHGRTLQFITNLYETCRASISNGTVSGDTFEVNIGVRQGCPLSPVLFSVFINDFASVVRDFGISIPGGKIGSFLFADDSMLISGTVTDLANSLARAHVWASRWGMQFNVPKCGAMGFGPGAHQMLQQHANILLLGESPVPVVDVYTYLGVPISHDLSLVGQKQKVVSRVSKALVDMGHLVRNKHLPISAALLLVRAFAVSACRYGTELLGSQATNHHGIHGKLTALIQAAHKFGPFQHFVASGVLSTDCGIPHVRALWQCNTVRVLRKHLHPRMQGSILHRVLNRPSQSRYSFRNKTMSMLAAIARHFNYTFNAGEGCIDLPIGLVRDYYVGIWRRGMESETRQESLIASGTLRPMYPMATWFNVLAQVRGINPLTVERAFLRLRHGQFLTVQRMQEKEMTTRAVRTCPLCDGDEPETVAHMLRRCTRWNAARHEHLASIPGTFDDDVEDGAWCRVVMGMTTWSADSATTAGLIFRQRSIVSYSAKLAQDLDNLQPSDDESEERETPDVRANGHPDIPRSARYLRTRFTRASQPRRDKILWQLRRLPLLHFLASILIPRMVLLDQLQVRKPFPTSQSTSGIWQPLSSARSGFG
jgi:DNA-binding transcriptional regulator YhcF (GntR family)